jgi:hypothetical protein
MIDQIPIHFRRPNLQRPESRRSRDRDIGFEVAWHGGGAVEGEKHGFLRIGVFRETSNVKRETHMSGARNSRFTHHVSRQISLNLTGRFSRYDFNAA